MKPIRHVRAHEVRLGGEVHEGWLPPGAAVPPPTPERVARLDLQILSEGGSGFVLEWRDPEGETCGDTWHFALEDAIAEATRRFGVRADEWRDGPRPEGVGRDSQ
jgi:hypothetical protein